MTLHYIILLRKMQRNCEINVKVHNEILNVFYNAIFQETHELHSIAKTTYHLIKISFTFGFLISKQTNSVTKEYWYIKENNKNIKLNTY
jgi:hypothetical protein